MGDGKDCSFKDSPYRGRKDGAVGQRNRNGENDIEGRTQGTENEMGEIRRYKGKEKYKEE